MPEDCRAPCPLQDEPDQDDAIGESTQTVLIFMDHRLKSTIMPHQPLPFPNSPTDISTTSATATHGIRYKGQLIRDTFGL